MPLAERLSESRMIEKVTYGLMRGRWKRAVHRYRASAPLYPGRFGGTIGGRVSGQGALGQRVEVSPR